MYLKM